MALTEWQLSFARELSAEASRRPREYQMSQLINYTFLGSRAQAPKLHVYIPQPDPFRLIWDLPLDSSVRACGKTFNRLRPND